MSELGDTIIILPPDKVAVIMEQHFNTSMFKDPLKVIDLKATDLGYAFTLSFDSEQQPQKVIDMTDAKPKAVVRKKA